KPSDGGVGTRGRETSREASRGFGSRTQIGGHLVCDLARWNLLRLIAQSASANGGRDFTAGELHVTANDRIDRVGSKSFDCPERVSAKLNVRSVRPRNADGAPSTDFDLWYPFRGGVEGRSRH